MERFILQLAVLLSELADRRLELWESFRNPSAWHLIFLSWLPGFLIDIATAVADQVSAGHELPGQRH